MTDPSTAARRVAALALIPTSVGVFGAGLAWANTHDPVTSSSSSADQTPDPRIAAAQAKVDEARARLAELQAQLQARLDTTAPPSVMPDVSAIPTSAASPTTAATSRMPSVAPHTTVTVARTTAAPAPAPARTTAAATTAPPAPAVQTTTRASTRA